MTNVRSVSTGFLAILVLAACASNGVPSRSAAAAQVDQSWAEADGALLADAIAGSWRDKANRARDGFRHPRETLEFFRVGSRSRVIEISPSTGWYSEILAPYLRTSGTYIAANATATPDSGAGKRATGLKAKFAGDPARYDRVQWLDFDGKNPGFGAPGSADVVLTFRNVHNWRGSGQAEGMFKGFFDVLKPGGVLGVVEHRADADVPADDRSGYVSEAQVVALAEAAGFVLDGKSEVNANPKDTKDHPNGVWTLPPGNNHDPEDAQKYRDIGESDRMTLRFVKRPAP